MLQSHTLPLVPICLTHLQLPSKGSWQTLLQQNRLLHRSKPRKACSGSTPNTRRRHQHDCWHHAPATTQQRQPAGTAVQQLRPQQCSCATCSNTLCARCTTLTTITGCQHAASGVRMRQKSVACTTAQSAHITIQSAWVHSGNSATTCLRRPCFKDTMCTPWCTTTCSANSRCCYTTLTQPHLHSTPAQQPLRCDPRKPLCSSTKLLLLTQ
jgi:hypothetical protein